MNRLSGPGWGVLIGGCLFAAAGLALGYPTLTGVGLAAPVALGGAAAVTLIRPRTTIDRELLPDRVTVGQSALIRLAVRNTATLPAPGFDAVQPLDDRPHRMRVPPLAGHQSRLIHMPVPTAQRGLVRVDPVQIHRRDPLGLMRRAESRCAQSWLWVRPRVLPLPALPLGVVPDFEGRLAEQAPKGSTAFAALRGYLPGDDFRHIHWRSSARVGALMVREHLDTTEPTTAIVVDTRSAVLDHDRFEEAVTLAASVAEASTRTGQSVTLAADGEDREAIRRIGGYHVLDRLSALSQRAGGDVTALIRMVERMRPGGCLVVLTGDEPGLLPRLAVLRRRFARVVVVLFDTGPGHAEAGASVPVRIMRRTGLVVIRTGSANDAAQAWSRLAAGGPA